METLSSLKQGDKVYFGRSHGEQTLGEVVKVNRVKVKVRQLESRGMYKSHAVGTVWTVPVSLLVKADPSTKAAEPPVGAYGSYEMNMLRSAGYTPRTMAPEVQNRLRENQDRDFAAMTGNRVKRPEADILVEIRRIYSGLSPENLHCDGEISRSAAARRGVALNRRLRECFVELGRRVSEGEAFGY
jgi:hypothetical protein